MRTLIVVFSCLFYCTAIAQHPLKFEEVQEVESLTKKQLFDNARIFLNKTFVKSQEVINIEDKEQGLIAGKGIIRVEEKAPLNKVAIHDFRFTIEIRVKEGRYKYTLTDFVHEQKVGFSMGLITDSETYTGNRPLGFSKKLANNLYIKRKDTIIREAKIFIDSLKNSMTDTANTNSDW